MDNNKELQLEQVAERAVKNAQQLNLAPPIFELYAALLSLSLAIIMFLMPNILEGQGGFYASMIFIMPQVGWAMTFFMGGILSSVGMLFDNKKARIFALCVLSLLFGILTVLYAILLPNFGFVLMVWITIFTIASIPLVKYTGIWNKKD